MWEGAYPSHILFVVLRPSGYKTLQMSTEKRQ